ncbi:MAG TPA: DUF1365 domain-containing protein [Alphaproteobacteria bacterium]|nr:DUF1365 domain-containing protein [Alphaproteobacteria bacterium]HBA42427.1 DUF1365 domain-containing protein [Alphaproteobacteria bacterium]
MSGNPQSAVYFGHVMHARLRPFRHRFVYRVFSLFLDIDRLDEFGNKLRFFSHNRFNLFSLYDRDHGARTNHGLREWVAGELTGAGVAVPDGRYFMLCFPRVLGYVFNPLTVFFCFTKSGQLRALIYEVRNTFGDKHPYVIPIGDDGDGCAGKDGQAEDPEDAEDDKTHAVLTHRRDKGFYVSPFIGMAMQYRFRLRVPGEKLSVMIRETASEEADAELLIATLTGQRRPLRDRTLLLAFIRYPLMTLKVMAGIHFEALRLWRKGATFYSRDSLAAGQSEQKSEQVTGR